MANCVNCSAPLQPNSITCEYCGSRNDVDLKGINYYTTNQPESERICPRCNTGLQTIDLKLDGTFLIERCDGCLGLFFDPGELEALLEATVKNVFTIDRGQLDRLNSTPGGSDYGVVYVKCPFCSQFMNRVNFGAKSGVIVDRCREHGVWLDGGELRHLFEWMKAGGKLLQQEREQRQKTELKEQARAERSPTAPLPGVPGTEDSGFSLFGAPLRRSDPDLFDLVANAIGFFLK